MKLQKWKKLSGVAVLASAVIGIVYNPYLISAQPEEALDYILGRPLTEDEIEEQQSYEPEAGSYYFDPVEVESLELSGLSRNYQSLPQAYDAREIGVITSVKNQNPYGT